MTTTGTISLPPLDGMEVAPGITLLGEPTPIPGTNLLRALANVGGALCLIELKFKFAQKESIE